MSLLVEICARRDEILRIARERGLTNIKIFGSVARGEERPDSDIDILVTSIPGVDTGWALFNFPSDLENMFGRKVDMVFETGLYHVIKDRVLKEAKPL